jgi:hypothetical protein
LLGTNQRRCSPPQQSLGWLNGDQREFFHALDQPFVHCGPLKVGLDADRLSRILDPLVNNCLAQTIITEGSSQHLQSFCTGFPIFNTKFNSRSLLFRGIHYECDKEWERDRT